MWEIKGLDDDPLPLFAAADGLQGPMPKIIEQPVLLPLMRAGAEVVEDYRRLRAQPTRTSGVVPEAHAGRPADGPLRRSRHHP